MARRKRRNKKIRMRKWETAGVGGAGLLALLVYSGSVAATGGLAVGVFILCIAYAVFNWLDGDNGIIGTGLLIFIVAAVLYSFGDMWGLIQ